MNKKRFTLLVASLMLMLSVFSVNAADPPSYGDPVKFLPKSGTKAHVGKGAYHLQLTGVGNTLLTHNEKRMLVMDKNGYAVLRDSTYLHPTDLDSGYYNLRTALWCVKVKDAEAAGKQPDYEFMNKEFGLNLAISNSKAFYKESFVGGVASAQPKFKIRQFQIGLNHDVLLAGKFTGWRFSKTYYSAGLEQNRPLAIEIAPDTFLTFAKKSVVDTDLYIVRVHANDLKPTSDFYKKFIARFTLVNAGPRVLRAIDFNTKLRELDKEDYVTLAFDKDVSAGQTNLFTTPLKAEDAISPGYLNLKNKDLKYIRLMADKSDKNYYNKVGTMYPKFGWASTVSTDGQTDFRFVYYPSEDSVVANVRAIDHKILGKASDNFDYTTADSLYNWTILNRLIVRMQDLSTLDTARVITVYDSPANTRLFFGIKDCKTYVSDRTTVKTDLYVITDEDGRTLVVPLFAGDFTPKWMYLEEENEVALKTPSYQWIVTQVVEGYDQSRVHLINREFDWMRIEFVQLYNNPTPFKGYTGIYDGTGVVDYTPIDGNLVSASGFKRVEGDARTDKYLGYKHFHKDSINYWAYSFNYLNSNSKDYYFGFQEKDDEVTDEKLLYVRPERTYFELSVADSLSAYGHEKYGAGHTSLYGGFGDFKDYKNLKDVALLQRYYYYMQVNDYYKFKRQDEYVTLGTNQRYKTDELVKVTKSELGRAKFYLRFTHEVDGDDYYSLVDRIDKSKFNYMKDVLGLELMKELKVTDKSHGSILNKSFGVVSANVNDNDLVVMAQPKTVGDQRVSTYKLDRFHEPLYRRFNTTLEDDNEGDHPKVLKIHRYNNSEDFVYEDSHSMYSYTKKQLPGQEHSSIRFMGVINSVQDQSLSGKDQIYPHDFNIYIDTAYVNRGTGWIKPQYLLVMNPTFGKAGVGCTDCGDTIIVAPYTRGRYLRNMTDSARVNPENILPNSPVRQPNGKFYLHDGTWERLAFVDAIHVVDTLFILNGYEPKVEKTIDGVDYIDFNKLSKQPLVKRVRLDNNLHKDEVFSMRFVERQVDSNSSKRFMIESETTNRNTKTGRMIAPTQGGWVKLQNGVPVISRGAYYDAIIEAEIWDVIKGDGFAVSNESVVTNDVIVVAGTDQVTIHNAEGKRVTISNVLGQVVAATVIQGNSATISAPKGVVVVTIEGEKSVKALVK